MVFNDYLVRWKNANLFPHALIIRNLNCCDLKMIAKKYLKTLVCKDNLFCDECNDCLRINSNNYIDFIYIENDEENVHKQEIIQIQNIFNKDAIEQSKVKLYVIKNIELANKQVINSILKFLEEPPVNTYALFFCQNEQAILPTIKSRSQTITIKDKMNEYVDEEYNDLCASVFNDVSEYNAFIEESNFAKIVKLANMFLLADKTSSQVETFNEIKLLSRYEFEIFVKILIELVPINKKIIVLDILKNIRLNMNKNLTLIKLMNEIL